MLVPYSIVTYLLVSFDMEKCEFSHFSKKIIIYLAALDLSCGTWDL